MDYKQAYAEWSAALAGTEYEAELERIARAHHCTCMMLCSGQERIGAHEAYRRMGFSDTITKGFKKML